MSKILVTLNGWDMDQMGGLNAVMRGSGAEGESIRAELNEAFGGAYKSSALDVLPYRFIAQGEADVDVVVGETGAFMTAHSIPHPAVVYYANERDSGDYPLDNHGWVVVEHQEGATGAVWGDILREDVIMDAVRDMHIRKHHEYLHGCEGFLRYDSCGHALFMFDTGDAVYEISADVHGRFRCNYARNLKAYIVGQGCHVPTGSKVHASIKDAYDFIKEAKNAYR